MTEYGKIVSYQASHATGIIEAEEDGAHVVVDGDDLAKSNLSSLKRHYRVAFDRVDGDDGHVHAQKIQMLQPIGSGATHRHVGDRRWTRAARRSF